MYFSGAVLLGWVSNAGGVGHDTLNTKEVISDGDIKGKKEKNDRVKNK